MNRPRPVMNAASISGVITAAALVLGFLGYSNDATTLSGEAQGIGAAIVGAVALGAHLLAGLHAQGKVTPNSSPKAEDGITDLVPDVSVQRAAPAPLVYGTAAPKSDPADPVPFEVPADDALSVSAALAAAEALYPAPVPEPPS